MKLTYVIKFVGDMDRALAFHRDTLGLPLKFASPHWSEFVTGETTLALHPASEKNPRGTVELGFGVPDLQKFFEEMTAKGVVFSMPPRSRILAVCWRSLSTRRAATRASRPRNALPLRHLFLSHSSFGPQQTK
jgi:catechol 2,3-dioxygenase-like lactoylglutathione lyase family enzyme